MVNEILRDMDKDFDELYADSGRLSIAPEYLLRAFLLQILYSIRSERQLMDQIDFNILFWWFVGLSIDAPVWDHSSFTKNRDRLLESEMAKFFGASVLCVKTVVAVGDKLPGMVGENLPVSCP